MDALALLARMASAVPPPKQHLPLCAGVLALSKPVKPSPSGSRCRYIKWAELLRLTFGLNVDQCLPVGNA